MRGEIVTPGAFLCQDLGSFDHFIVQGFVFAEHVWTYIHPGLLYTPGKVYASMLNDLAISRGEEEIEKPDFTVVFYTDIAASRYPVCARQI